MHTVKSNRWMGSVPKRSTFRNLSICIELSIVAVFDWLALSLELSRVRTDLSRDPPAIYGFR